MTHVGGIPSWSVLGAPTDLCDLGCSSSATVSCLDCSLLLCFPCAYSRHAFGTLTKHKLQFVPFATPRYQALMAEAQGQQQPASGGGSGVGPARNRLRATDLCQYCDQEPNVLRCPVCDIRFCTACADAFHHVAASSAASPGGSAAPIAAHYNQQQPQHQQQASKASTRASWLSHKLKYEYCADVPVHDTDDLSDATGQRSSAPSQATSPAGGAGGGGGSLSPLTARHLHATSPHQRVYNQAMQHARLGGNATPSSASLTSSSSLDEQRRLSASVPLTPQQQQQQRGPHSVQSSPIAGGPTPVLQAVSVHGGGSVTPAHQTPHNLALPSGAVGADGGADSTRAGPGHTRTDSGLPHSPNRTLNFDAVVGVTAAPIAIGVSSSSSSTSSTPGGAGGEDDVTMPRFLDSKESPQMRSTTDPQLLQQLLSNESHALALPPTNHTTNTHSSGAVSPASASSAATSPSSSGSSGSNKLRVSLDDVGIGAGGSGVGLGGPGSLSLPSSARPHQQHQGRHSASTPGGQGPSAANMINLSSPFMTSPGQQQQQQQHPHTMSHSGMRSRSVLLSSPPLSNTHAAFYSPRGGNGGGFGFGRDQTGPSGATGNSSSSSAGSGPLKAQNNISTFKLANYTLGYLSSACPPPSKEGSAAPFQVSLDQANRLLSVSSTGDKDASNGVHYARHLSSIHAVTSDVTDPRRLTISFRDNSATAASGAQRPGLSNIVIKLYAMTVSEARMIQELLALMSAEFDAKDPINGPTSAAGSQNTTAAAADSAGVSPAGSTSVSPSAATGTVAAPAASSSHHSPPGVPSSSTSPPLPVPPERPIADTDIIYIGRVLKRGKMSWAPRWLVLKKFHLRVYKTSKLHVPSNNISLSGAKVAVGDDKEKHLTLICMDRPYTFKLSDAVERDSLVSLFAKAMELRRSGDGSISMSSIGGSMPQPASTQQIAASSFTANANTPFGGSDAADGGAAVSADGWQSARGSGPGNASGDDDPSAMTGSLSRTHFEQQRGGRSHTVFVPSSSPMGSPPPQHPNASSALGHQLSLHLNESGGFGTGGAGDAAGSAAGASEQHARDLARARMVGATTGLGVAGRRKSRRTISRDFHNVISKHHPASHALALEEGGAGGVGGGAHFSSVSSISGGGGGVLGLHGTGGQFGAGGRIEFAEFALDSRSQFVRPSRTLVVGVYAFMKLLGESMVSGAHLSPVLYVPKAVWAQHGAKIQAFGVKVELVEQLRVSMLAIMPPPLPMSRTGGGQSSAASAAGAAQGIQAVPFSDDLERSLSSFRLLAEEVQDKLASHLSFIHTVKERYKVRVKQSRKEGLPVAALSVITAQQQAAAAGAGGGGGMGGVGGGSGSGTGGGGGGGGSTNDGDDSGLSLGEKLSKSMKTFGKIVSRAASASKDKLDHEDSTRYIKLLHTVFDQALVFREWMSFIDSMQSAAHTAAAQHHPAAADGAASASAAAGPSVAALHAAADASWPANKALIEEHLIKISEFFYCVLCNMVVRDLKSVLKRYIKHCMRTLVSH